jgi:hypothetical protein
MPSKPTYPLAAQAETLLIYGIFLFLTGLAQIGVTISHRYILEKTVHQHGDVYLRQFFPAAWTFKEIHLWFIYPSAALVSRSDARLITPLGERSAERRDDQILLILSDSNHFFFSLYSNNTD